MLDPGDFNLVLNHKEIHTIMKKFMSVMLGLSLVLGLASVSFAEDKKEDTKKEGKKKGKKKTAEEKK